MCPRVSGNCLGVKSTQLDKIHNHLSQGCSGPAVSNTFTCLFTPGGYGRNTAAQTATREQQAGKSWKTLSLSPAGDDCASLQISLWLLLPGLITPSLVGGTGNSPEAVSLSLKIQQTDLHLAHPLAKHLGCQYDICTSTGPLLLLLSSHSIYLAVL